jgi:hypothetical protein
MGDRSNIVVRDRDGKDVVFYAHWSGSSIAAVVRCALAKEWRWTDDNYLARIIFCELVKGHEADETGFGIGRSLAGDREHPVVFVDVQEQRVSFCNDFTEDAAVDTKAKLRRADFTWSFADYAKMTDEEVTDLLDRCEVEQ